MLSMIPSQRWKFLVVLSSDRRRRAISLAAMLRTSSTLESKTFQQLISTNWLALCGDQTNRKPLPCFSVQPSKGVFYQLCNLVFARSWSTLSVNNTFPSKRKGHSLLPFQLTTEHSDFFAQGTTRRRPSESTSLVGVDLEASGGGNKIYPQ